MELFTCDSHNQFLAALLKKKKKGRGFHSRLAEALNVHPSYVSKVASGNGNLTLEQGYILSNWLQFNDLEQEYLSVLIQKDRAANHLYRGELKRKLSSLQEKKNDIGTDFKPNSSMGSAESAYYVSWLCSAIHILMTIPGYNSLSSLATRLRVTTAECTHALQILEHLGLVQRHSSKWELTSKRLYVSNENPLATAYHSAWSDRLNCVLGLHSPGSVRYTGVHSISKADWERLRNLMRDFLKSINTVVAPSKEETLVAIRIDAGEIL